MIEFTFGNKKRNEAICQYTHANGAGWVTTFVFAKGITSASSFNLSEFDTVEKFLVLRYPNVSFNTF